MVDALLLDGRLRNRGVFNDQAIARLWREHRSGRRDHRHRLWSLVMLELWFREFLDGATQNRARAAQAIATCAQGKVARRANGEAA